MRTIRLPPVGFHLATPNWRLFRANCTRFARTQRVWQRFRSYKNNHNHHQHNHHHHHRTCARAQINRQLPSLARLLAGSFWKCCPSNHFEISANSRTLAISGLDRAHASTRTYMAIKSAYSDWLTKFVKCLSCAKRSHYNDANCTSALVYCNNNNTSLARNTKGCLCCLSAALLDAIHHHHHHHRVHHHDHRQLQLQLREFQRESHWLAARHTYWLVSPAVSAVGCCLI